MICVCVCVCVRVCVCAILVTSTWVSISGSASQHGHAARAVMLCPLARLAMQVVPASNPRSSDLSVSVLVMVNPCKIVGQCTAAPAAPECHWVSPPQGGLGSIALPLPDLVAQPALVF